jgi:esterase
MELAFRELGGAGQPILFLHGLFGSSQNWTSIGRRLSDLGRAVALDLRNHGSSPHAPSHTLADCVGDLGEWAERHARGRLRLVGHSMGGLVAMGFAIARAELVDALAVIDIAPRPYPLDHEREFAALLTRIHGCATRADLDALLAPVIPDPAGRRFLLTNAVRRAGGQGFEWRINTTALLASTVSRDFAGIAGSFSGPSLFVAGGRSAYLTEKDRPAVLRHFPRARIQVIPSADHMPHVSAPAELEAVLRDFFLPLAAGTARGKVQ